MRLAFRLPRLPILRGQSPAARSLPVRFDRATGRITVIAGPHRFWIESDDTTLPGRHATVDFAVYGLAGLSMSAGLSLTIDDPVSRAMASTLARMTQAFDLLALPRLHPLRITLTQVVDDPAVPVPDRGLLCLSGGIDSTFAATEARHHGVTHGLLIAGADYPDAECAGYRELRQRVDGIARRLGLQLTEVRTTIRTVPFRWDMLHALNLAMCLTFLAPDFRQGAFALDNTLLQDLARHPWGNSAGLASTLGQRSFPIHSYGQNHDRVEKLRAIAATDPGLLPLLSVCWRDTAQGGNCGACTKCVMTRLNLLAISQPEAAMFPDAPPLQAALSALRPSRKPRVARGELLRLSENLWHLPDDPRHDALKGILRDRVAALRRRLPKT